MGILTSLVYRQSENIRHLSVSTSKNGVFDKLTKKSLKFWADIWFYVAVLAAPLAWMLLATTSFSVHVESGLAGGLQALMFTVIIYPVLEELVFRGYLQTWLSARIAQFIYRISLANVLTSVAFTAAHCVNASHPLTLLVFFPSIVFGCAKERYNSLLPPILLHALYNLVGYGS